MVGKSNKQIDAYAKKHFSDVIDHFQTADLVYDKKNHTYYKKYVDKLSDDWFFTITYQKDKKIIDDYQTSYVEGTSLKKVREKQINQSVKKQLESLTTIEKPVLSLSISLSELESEHKNALISGKHLETIPIFTLNGTKSLKSKDQESITNHLKSLEEEIKNFPFVKTLCMTYTTPQGKITLTLDRTRLMSPNLLGMIEFALEKPRSAKENYGILLEEE